MTHPQVLSDERIKDLRDAALKDTVSFEAPGFAVNFARAIESATLEALSAQNPVAVIGSAFQLLWARAHWSAGINVGDKLYLHPSPTQPPAQAEREWLPIEAAPEDMDKCVVVRWTDSEGNEQHDFDYTEDGTWMHWHDRAEHTEMIGGHGVSHTPPYEHWMPLPPPPAALKGRQ